VQKAVSGHHVPDLEMIGLGVSIMEALTSLSIARCVRFVLKRVSSMTGLVFQTLVIIEDTARSPPKDCLKVLAKDAAASCKVTLTRPRSLLGESLHFGTRQRLSTSKVYLGRSFGRPRGGKEHILEAAILLVATPLLRARNKSGRSRPHEPLECMVKH
jgi:hypothetical protein